jgi:hypothetical protein
MPLEAMKSASCFLNSTTDRSGRSVSLTPTKWVGVWVDPRFGLDALENRKVSAAVGSGTLDPRVFEPVVAWFMIWSKQSRDRN